MRPDLIHCRSYLPIPIGVAIKRKFGGKLLIDFRHFFVEAGIEDSPFKLVYRAIKTQERSYFAAADHVVTLTQRVARILNGWYQSEAGLDRFTVIPCCADFDHFNLRNVPSKESRKLRHRLGFGEQDYVLLYLGSIGPDYLLTQMMELFRELLTRRPNAKFLFVSNNGEQLVDARRRDLDIPAEAVRFVTAPRDDIPAYLSITNLSVLFYRADLSRAGCSPTKLAELLAANVPVIANSNVGDLDSILSIERNCSVVVPDFQKETLRRALERVLSVSPADRSRIRENSREFSLEEGVRRYDRIYKQLEGEASLAAVEPEPVRV
jgi:glycosyltransferase involved in cell wall biosynthesis